MQTKTFNLSDTTEALPKIFLFIEGENNWGVFPSALAEDGHCLAGYCSSNKSFAMHDIGFNSTWKHDNYKKHYPNGYELVWLESDELEGNTGFLKAVENNNNPQSIEQESEQKQPA
jgi:hypothetical protein